MHAMFVPQIFDQMVPQMSQMPGYQTHFSIKKIEGMRRLLSTHFDLGWLVAISWTTVWTLIDVHFFWFYFFLTAVFEEKCST